MHLSHVRGRQRRVARSIQHLSQGICGDRENNTHGRVTTDPATISRRSDTRGGSDA